MCLECSLAPDASPIVFKIFSKFQDQYQMSPASVKLSPVLPNVNLPVLSVPIVYSVHSTVKVLKTFCFRVYIDFKYLQNGNSVLFSVPHTYTLNIIDFQCLFHK